MAKLDYVHPLLTTGPENARYDADFRRYDQRPDGKGEGQVILKLNPEIDSVKAHRAGVIEDFRVLAEATIVSRYSSDERGSWLSARIVLTSNLSESTVQRFNRLVRGTGLKLQWYHRTDSIQLRVPGEFYGRKAGRFVDPATTIELKRLATSSGVDTIRIVSVGDDKATRGRLIPKREAEAGAAKRLRRDIEAAKVVPAPKAPESAPDPFSSVSGSLRAKPSVTKTDSTGLFTYPTLRKSSEVVVERETLAGLDSLWAMHVKGVKQVIALTGPTGTGKTSLAYGLAARNDVGIMVFDAAGAREFSDWTGTTQLKDGKTAFVPSGFLDAIDADGRYAGEPRIVLIDELNRAESSGALNALIPVLHGFGSLYVPELGRSVSIDANVLIIATLNRGSAYAGTVGLDLALADRVTAWVEMAYLDEKREEKLLIERAGISPTQAAPLVRAAKQVRLSADRGELPEGGGISTRRLLDAAFKVNGGMSLHTAAVWSWVGSFPNEGGTSSEAHIVKTAIDGILRGQ